MQNNKIPRVIKEPILIKVLSMLIFTASPLLFLIVNILFPELSFLVSVFLFILMLLGIFLGMHLYTTGSLAEKFISILQTRECLYKKIVFLQSKITFEYNDKQFELISFSRFKLHSIYMTLVYGDIGRGFPKSHLELWVLTTADIYCNESPYTKVTRKYAYDLGEFMKPHKYINEAFKEYGNISDLFFLGFTKRGKNKYLLAMLEWGVKPDTLAETLDAMSGIIEKYEKR